MSSLTSQKLFNAFHDLYLAYYFQSKGCGIERERMNLTAIWGTHKHLCSYFKCAVKAFNAMSNRSKLAFQAKWKREFREDLTDNYIAMKALNKRHRLAGLAPVATDSVIDAANVVSCDEDAFDPFKACELDDLRAELSKTLADIDMHPNRHIIPAQVNVQLARAKGDRK